jgi:hypothetical protein
MRVDQSLSGPKSPVVVAWVTRLRWFAQQDPNMNADIADIDRWIQLLMTCKQLPENDVKKLCEKVLRKSLSHSLPATPCALCATCGREGGKKCEIERAYFHINAFLTLLGS